jgi:hypothetical protein
MLCSIDNSIQYLFRCLYKEKLQKMKRSQSQVPASLKNLFFENSLIQDWILLLLLST